MDRGCRPDTGAGRRTGCPRKRVWAPQWGWHATGAMPPPGTDCQGDEIDMTIPRILVLLTCFLMMGILGCGDGEAERKTQALNTARNWTETSTEPVIAEIVTLATDRVSGASLFSDLIADQIAQSLSWDYSEPVKTTENIYEVTATVSTQVSLDLPLLGSKTYKASLPFDLQVDVSTGSVVRWSADLTGASVGEIEPAS